MFRHVLSMLSLLLFCLATLSGCSHSLDARYSGLAFDETHWKTVGEMTREDRSSAKNLRAKMLDDLVKNHLRQGMSKEEVEMLLGPRDDVASERSDDWVYYFPYEGFEDIHPWDASGSHFVVLRFDKDSKYIKYEIVWL